MFISWKLMQRVQQCRLISHFGPAIGATYLETHLLVQTGPWTSCAGRSSRACHQSAAIDSTGSRSQTQWGSPCRGPRWGWTSFFRWCFRTCAAWWQLSSPAMASCLEWSTSSHSPVTPYHLAWGEEEGKMLACVNMFLITAEGGVQRKV